MPVIFLRKTLSICWRLFGAKRRPIQSISPMTSSRPHSWFTKEPYVTNHDGDLCFRAFMFYRLPRYLGSDPGTTYALDGGDQCDQRDCCGRCHFSCWFVSV